MSLHFPSLRNTHTERHVYFTLLVLTKLLQNQYSCSSFIMIILCGRASKSACLLLSGHPRGFDGLLPASSVRAFRRRRSPLRKAPFIEVSQLPPPLPPPSREVPTTVFLLPPLLLLLLLLMGLVPRSREVVERCRRSDLYVVVPCFGSRFTISTVVDLNHPLPAFYRGVCVCTQQQQQERTGVT